jgi:hypothetical protein
MNIVKLAALSLFVIVVLAACGADESPVASRTTINGLASKGPIVNGTVRIYAVTNGARGELLATVSTDANGSYTADIGGYVGPVIAEASGPYLDEATGLTKNISADSPLRAVIPQAQGAVSLPVTPLTELAVVKTGGALTPEAITAANTLVSDLFKVDIINTLPVAPTAMALASATQAQKDYTLALAVVSQMSSGADLTTTLSTLSQGITATGMTAATVATVQTALTTFVTTNEHNQTGVTSTAQTNLVNVGSTGKSYTLVLSGNVPVGGARGIQFDLILPAGVTLNLNGADPAVPASSLSVSGNAPQDALLAARYASGTVTFGLITAKGTASGQFATFTCNVASGGAAPAASAFSVANLRVVDERGSTIPGVTVTIN